MSIDRRALGVRLFPLLLMLLSLAVAGVAKAQIPGTAGGEAVGEAGVAQETDTGAAALARALIDVLRDDRARAAFVGELERIARAPGDAAAPAAGEAAEQAPAGSVVVGEATSLGRRVAVWTQEGAQTLAAWAVDLRDRLAVLPSTLQRAASAANLEVLVEALIDLALLIVATYAVFVTLRYAAKRLYRRMGRAAAEGGAVGKFLLVLGSIAVDATVVLVAWAAGYVIALVLLGSSGSIGIRQTLYLNAFLAVELVKVLVRAVLSPTTGDLRIVALKDAAARHLARWLNVLVAILGYGQLLVVPIVDASVSRLAGQAVDVAVSLLLLATATFLVLRHRRQVADWLVDADSGSARASLLRPLAGIWHVAVLAYLAALFLIVVTRPGGVLLPVLAASVKILAAVVAGVILTGALTRAMARGVRLPERVDRAMPGLERRLAGFVPRLLLVLRVLVFVAVVAFAVHTVGLVDMEAWFVSGLGAELFGRLAGALLILLLALLVWLALTSWIDYRLNPSGRRVATVRQQTLLTLLRNAATIAIVVVTAMFALSQLGLDIAPLIASAGVVGLAIGFGAQKLVQDIITGVFIQFENAINVGDVVTAGGTTGVVERLTIRSVSLRDVNGVFHIIPFSSVDMVSNFMRGFAFSVCDMGVAYREDLEEVRVAMFDAFEELRARDDMKPSIVGDMEWFGINAFADSAVIVRTRIKTRPGQQWNVGRAYNGIIKRIFDERGIEIPFPHQTLYFGEDKKGGAPPAHVRIEPEPKGATTGEAQPAVT